VKAVAVTLSIACPEGTVQGEDNQDRALGTLAAFRRELYRCSGKRPDALAELADAALCKPDRVHMLAELSLVSECRRGHGAVYDAVNGGRVQIARLRRSPARCRSRPGRTAGSGGRCQQLAASPHVVTARRSS
jgi:hypothetical protein